MCALLVALVALAASGDRSEALALRVEVAPREARLTDVLFVRVSIENRSDDPVTVSHSCLLETGTLSLKLYDPREHTSYSFVPDGCPAGWGGDGVLLEPHKSRVMSLLIVRLPRLGRINYRFWKPELWKDGNYELFAGCAGVSGSGGDIHIDRRPEKEMKTLLEYYGAGPYVPVLSDWDSDRPSLAMFGLLSFPLACSKPENLAALEKTLSPGSLRRVVHITRLAQDLYDAEDDQQQRQAITALEEWLDGLADIEREWMSREFFNYCTNIGRGSLRFLDMAERLVPRMPDSSRGLSRSGRESALREVQAKRKSLEQVALIKHGRGEPLRPPVWKANDLAALRAAGLSSLIVALDVHSHKIQVGDPVYVRVLIRNTGEQPVLLPSGFKRSWGNLRFELYSPHPGYMYWFPSDGGLWAERRDEPLEPGAVRVIYDQLYMPRMDQLDEPFWNLDETSMNAQPYNLVTWLRLDENIHIQGGLGMGSLYVDQRDEEERTAIKQFYDGGTAKHRLVPPDWDLHRPTMRSFSLHGFPLEHNTPEKLADFEEKLSPGSLRRVVHITRLAQDLYDAKDAQRQRQAINALEKWLDGLTGIEREWMSMALFNCCILAPKPCMLDLAERIVPRMPDSSRGVNKGGRDKALKEIKQCRKRR